MPTRANHRRWSLLIVFSLLLATFGPISSAQEATPGATPIAVASGTPVLMFASDGMRPDLVARYSQAGITPTFAELAANGSVGKNGLLQAFPPNTGTGWATLSTGTWPGEHGSVNNSFYETGDSDFNNRTSAYEPGVLQAQSIAQAAEQNGQTVVAVQWTGTTGLSPQLDGPAIDYWTEFSSSAVLANYDLGPDEGYQHLSLTTATSWTNVPASYSPALEQQFKIATTNEQTNPNRAYSLYIYDSTDDNTVNYDRVLVVAGDATDAGATSAASSIVATPVASSVIDADSKDGTNPLADLAVGDWQDIKVTLSGEQDGLTAGFHIKLIELAADASSFRIYATSIARYNATYNGCNYAPGCAEPTGFAEDLAANFPSATGADFFPLEHGLIDEETYVEQGLMPLAHTELHLDHILNDLNVKPDLLMLGAPVTDEFSHQFLGLITQNGPDSRANPRFDDANNDGTPDGRVEAREGFIQQSYAETDGLLAHAMGTLGEANVIVTSDHGFAPQWYAVNGPLVLQQAGVTPGQASSNCRIPEGADPATVQAKICTTGGSAHIYLNVIGRDVPGAVSEEEYNAVRQKIVDAFTAVKDPGNPGATVVAGVYLKEEINDTFGIGAMHPSRTGDVVVVLAPPYQFDTSTPGKVIAPSMFFGQHGYMPELVDLDANINMHGTFIASGPAFINGTTVADVRAIDVAPTVAYLLGVPGPANASGNILYAALADGAHLAELTIVSSATTTTSSPRSRLSLATGLRSRR